MVALTTVLHLEPSRCVLMLHSDHSSIVDDIQRGNMPKPLQSNTLGNLQSQNIVNKVYQSLSVLNSEAHFSH